MRRRLATVALTLGIISSLIACGPPPLIHRENAASSRTPTRLVTQADLRKLPQTLTLHDVVAFDRLGLLRGRQADVVVYIDGRPIDNRAMLHEIPVARLRELRLLSGSEATLRYGRERRPGVVLDVTTGPARL